MLRAIRDLTHAGLLGLVAANLLFISGEGGASQVVLVVKNSPASARDGRVGSISGLERSLGGGHGNPLQHFCLENPHGQRSLAGYSPWGHEGLDTAEATEHVGVGMLFQGPRLSLGGWARVGHSPCCWASGSTAFAFLARIYPLHCLSPACLGRGRRGVEVFFPSVKLRSLPSPLCPQPTHPCGHSGSFPSRQSYLGIGCPK